MIVTGMLMRAAGFATMGIAHEPRSCGFPAFFPVSAVRFDPPRSALVVKLIRPSNGPLLLSLLMMQDSAGAVIGALLGSWLLQYDFRPSARQALFCSYYAPFSTHGCFRPEAINGQNAGA
ncbi:hypothetical protein JS565_20495 [Salmonella enterica subsp. enterica serovar Senftenberg]|nr:hypothetical protein [Salmonella enterica subsp. enterica serovar Senftenberg]